MKKRGLLVLLGSICLVFMLAAPSLAQVIKLTLADQNAEMGWGPVHALQPWVKKVEEATKGRVKIEIYPGSDLGQGTGHLERGEDRPGGHGLVLPRVLGGHDPSVRCHHPPFLPVQDRGKGK